MQPDSWLEDVHQHESDEQADRADGLEVQQRLGSQAADSAQVADARQAVNDGAEDDRGEQNPEQGNKAITERFHRDAACGRDQAERDPRADSDENLYVELFEQPHTALRPVTLLYPPRAPVQ